MCKTQSQDEGYVKNRVVSGEIDRSASAGNRNRLIGNQTRCRTRVNENAVGDIGHVLPTRGYTFKRVSVLGVGLKPQIETRTQQPICFNEGEASLGQISGYQCRIGAGSVNREEAHKVGLPPDGKLAAVAGGPEGQR